jgi:ABC-type metal ion transport system substrate-binding protein
MDRSRNEVNLIAVRQPRYSQEEFAQCGDALYESEVRQQVEEGNHGRIVAIDNRVK